MSEYYQAETSVNILDTNNVVSLLKLYGVNILLSLVLSLVMVMILALFGTSIVSSIGLFAVVLMGQLYAIRLFERWDGCHFKQIISN